MIRLKLGSIQRAGVEIYISDPAHDDERAEHGCRQDGDCLVVEDPEKAWRTVNDASNSADAHMDGLEPDRELSTALARLALRIARAAREASQ